VTGYLAGLVGRGLGRAPGPALEPRLTPEIASVSWQPQAPAPVEPAPATVGEVVEERVATKAPRPAFSEPLGADPPPVGDERPSPPRVEAPRGRRQPRSAEPAPPREGAPTAVQAEVPAASGGGEPQGASAAASSAAANPRRPEREQIVQVRAAPASRPPTAEDGHVARPLVELLPRAPAERPAIPAKAASAQPHVEVRIGRVEVRAPRAPEPWRPVEPAPLRETPADPFVGLAAARRYIDRAWR